MSCRVSIAKARLCDILKLFYGSDMDWNLNWSAVGYNGRGGASHAELTQAAAIKRNGTSLS